MARYTNSYKQRYVPMCSVFNPVPLLNKIGKHKFWSNSHILKVREILLVGMAPFHVYKRTERQDMDNSRSFNTFTAIVDLSLFNNSCLKSPTSTLVDLTFQSRALRSFSLNQLCNLSL